MSEWHARLLSGAVLGLMLSLMSALQYRRERRQMKNLGGRIYGSPIGSWMLYLPLAMPVYFLLRLGTPWISNASLWAEFLTIILTSSVYFMLLLFLTPLLRRYVRSFTCAMLWAMPNLLFLVRSLYHSPELSLAVPIPERTLRLLFWIWLGGFLPILLWKVTEHFLFRRRLVKSAAAVAEEDILALWTEACEAVGNTVYDLYRTPLLSTPLSLGFFESTTVVFLPERSYSEAELRMIFRHELIHIQRWDSVLKFFLVFSTAMCWFNPLLWLAMRLCAEDIELGCDEAVVQHMDGAGRRDYAELLLRTAGDGRGFTSCLSASARSLRCRMRCVMNPVRKWDGCLLPALTGFLLVMSYGLLSFVPG